MDILTEFDELQEALKKVKIDEDVMVYRNGMLVKNQDSYIKLTKLLNTPQMVECHQFLYECDVENLTPDEMKKIDQLYALACNRKYIDNSFNDELEADEKAEEKPVVDVTPAPVAPKRNYIPCWTVLYSATDQNGNAKCGECYSNSISVSAAKADAIAKLSRFGYGNIAILAIEAGDPDMVGCEDDRCTQPDCDAQECNDDACQNPECDIPAVTEAASNVDECDPLKGKFHNNHRNDVSESLSEDIVSTRDFEGENRHTLADIANAFCELVECGKNDNFITMMSEKEFEACCEKDIAEDDGQPAEETPAQDAPAEETPAQDAPAEETPAQDAPAEETPAEETPAQDAPAEETTDDQPAEDNDAEKSDDSETDTEDKTEDDSKSGDDDSNELDDAKKAEYKDKYQATFKEQMSKLEFFDKSFNQLSLDDKIKLLKAVKAAWKKNPEASEFMTDKQIAQLYAIVTPQPDEK